MEAQTSVKTEGRVYRHRHKQGGRYDIEVCENSLPQCYHFLNGKQLLVQSKGKNDGIGGPIEHTIIILLIFYSL